MGLRAPGGCIGEPCPGLSPRGEWLRKLERPRGRGLASGGDAYNNRSWIPHSFFRESSGHECRYPRSSRTHRGSKSPSTVPLDLACPPTARPSATSLRDGGPNGQHHCCHRSVPGVVDHRHLRQDVHTQVHCEAHRLGRQWVFTMDGSFRGKLTSSEVFIVVTMIPALTLSTFELMCTSPLASVQLRLWTDKYNRRTKRRWTTYQRRTSGESHNSPNVSCNIWSPSPLMPLLPKPKPTD